MNHFRFCLVSLLVSLNSWPVVANADPEDPIDEVVVTAQRREQPILAHAGNIDHLSADTISDVAHRHIHELMTRVAGVWVVRGSGQEHLTSIRSPVLTGGGSCGGFLLLEDGIPVRPSGFCNVNQFIELVSEQAASVEVIRGPGNALFGSNAVHGLVNVLMPSPSTASPEFAVEWGANDYYRLRADVPLNKDSPWLASLVYANDGGFREDSDYQQGKIHLKRQGILAGGDFLLGFSATDLDQDTAGFVFGKDAYKDPAVTQSNLNPEAFRKAQSQRLYGIWTHSLQKFDIDVRPFVRHSDMQFLHHFQPGLPLEKNGHLSAGIITAVSFASRQTSTVFGFDIEWSDVYLKQTQDQPTMGSRPMGKHYDYEVESMGLAGFVQSEFRINGYLSLEAGLRMDYLEYDYDNRMLDGNTRDDGTPCGGRGCLFTRPGDRTDSFMDFAPKLSVSYRLGNQSTLFSSLARGFRAPQMLELYRLQNGQQVSDLDSERIDAFELGIRHRDSTWSGELVIYSMRKRDSVFRDAEGFNVTGARSLHKGLELGVDWQLNPAWRVSVDGSYARHQYDFNAMGRGESFVAGRDMDSAPRFSGSAEIKYDPSGRMRYSLQWTTLDEYFLDAENRFTYPGHSLLNFRMGLSFSEKTELILRLNNLTDMTYADRADYANRNYRYFPGRGRELFGEIRYSPGR